MASLLTALSPTLVASGPAGDSSGFVSRRLADGALGLALLPVVAALAPRLGPTDLVLAICLAAPLLAALARTRFGAVDLAHAFAAAGTGGLVGLACLQPSPLAAVALGALALAPVEAARTGSRPAAISALAAGFAACFLTASAGFTLLAPVPAATALAACAGLALRAAVAAAAALRRSRPQVQGASLSGSSDDALDGLRDLVTWHDGQGDVLRANEGAALIGVRPEYLLGQGLLARVHVTDRPAFLKAISDAATDSGPAGADIRIHVAQGDGTTAVRWFELRAHGLRDRGAAALAFLIDRSTSRRDQEEVEAARLAAERANEMKGRFLATVSHELRTPLNAIIGFSELLVADHPYVLTDARRREYGAIIRDSGQHLLGIVNTLLDMSKIESGNFDVVPEPFAPGDLAQSCCELVRLKAEVGGITLVREIAPGLPDITADRRACRQILINLLSNAVKFTPAGGTVTLSVRVAGDRLALEVTDTGIGIREEDLPRLGDPFFQSNELHRRPHEGTGLGLSVVRGLVGLLGGTLAIESSLGQGTTVTVTLPLDGAGVTPLARPAKVMTAARNRPTEFDRMSA